MTSALLLLCALAAHAGPREYRLMAGPLNELEPLATDGRTAHLLLSDAYQHALGPGLPRSIEPIAEVVWSIFWTFNTSLWPHELGHAARADQLGGAFIIERYAFPFPVARMEMPDGIRPPESRTLSSVGGFEVNHLMLSQTWSSAHARNEVFADELIHAFIQDFYYPMYAWLIAPAAPRTPETWTDTRGDPVEGVLIVYENHTGRSAIRPNGTVDPELVSLYRETVFVNLGTVLLDPTFLQSATAFAKDMDYDAGRMTPWMVGSDTVSWMANPRFQASPLGYQVHLVNWLHLGEHAVAVTPWIGRPYRNRGLSVEAPDLVESKLLTLGAEVHGWDQDVYGAGLGAYALADVTLHDGLGLLVRGGWKTRGYLLGRQIDAGPTVLGGLSYRWTP